MAALRHAARRLWERALGRSPVIYERKFVREFPDIDPEYIKAARAFPKVHVKDADATALKVFKILQDSPVDGHQDVTLREVRMTLKALAEIQEEE